MAYKFNPFTAKLEEYGPVLTGTGTVSAAADGTAALPGIAFTNDLNTGIYRPGLNQLAISTNGTGRLFVDANGDITSNTSPSTGLSVRLYGTATGTNVDATTSRGVNLFLHQTSNTNNNASAILFANALTNTGAYIAAQYSSHTNRQTALVFGTGDNAAPTERARIDASGRLLVGTSTNTGGALFQVNDNRIRVATAKTPASATDTGSAGEICWDANYIYVCTATNTWKRSAIATW